MIELILRGHDYRYALEQTIVTLFSEKAKFSFDIPPTGDYLLSSLSVGNKFATAGAKLRLGGREVYASSRVPLSDRDEEVKRLSVHALKLAAFKAAKELTGKEYPWGSLTGVRPTKLLIKLLEADEKTAGKILTGRYLVSEERTELALSAAKFGSKVKQGLKPNEISIYVGIPFCPSRCSYCSFVSHEAGKSGGMVESYLKALRFEIELKSRTIIEAGLSVGTVYIGGGTPTVLTAPQLDELMTAIEECLPLRGISEYTVEAGRPDTITPEKLRVLSAHGCDRISINPQSMSQDVLNWCGRPHTPDDVLRAFDMAKAVGFRCINMDTIAGLGRDSADGFARTIDKLLSLNPENITVHTLAVKRGADIRDGADFLPAEGEVAEMLEYANRKLSSSGYAPYYLYRQKYMAAAFENTGWSRPGFEGIYNVCIMEEFQSIISFGAGGMTKLVGGGLKRMANSKYPREYIADRSKIESDNIKLKEYYRP